MGDTTGISWTDKTWNPWQGCFKVSQGCKQCYMYREKLRFGQQPNVVVRSKPKTFNAPLKWEEPALVFTCSWSDWFIEEADEWRDEAWDVIRHTPHLTYQILTKRPERILGHLPQEWPLSNVWLGVSVEDQAATYRMPYLEAVNAPIKFVSYEPALGYVDFKAYPWLDWLIAGGESGILPRLIDMDIYRQVRDDCKEVGIPFFFKQYGGNSKIDGAWGGEMIDGQVYHNFPLTK